MQCGALLALVPALRRGFNNYNQGTRAELARVSYFRLFRRLHSATIRVGGK